MYPAGELNLLLTRKAALQRRIAVTRLVCAIHGARVVRPLVWIDQVAGTWRQAQPLVRLAAVPLGLWLMRVTAPRVRRIAALWRWAPAVFGALRVFMSRPTPAAEPAPPAA